jgi:hypothetical protein
VILLHEDEIALSESHRIILSQGRVESKF